MKREATGLREKIIRSILKESGRNITEDDLAQMMDLYKLLEENVSLSTYSYEHPNYKALVKEIPVTLRPLLSNDEEHDNLIPYDDLMDECSKMERSVLVDVVNSLIYFWLDKWHRVNDDQDEDSGIWLHPMHLAILMAEHFTLRECLPALLEIERQDHDFMNAFFDDSDMTGMTSSCIYQIATVDDLPLLGDFMHERGIRSISKAEVLAAVATLPRRESKWLQPVQQWFCDILTIFADDIDPQVGDLLLLEAIINGCIHTRCVAAKPMIIRLYNKYKMPNFLIPGGVNEVRKTIKKASIGLLAEGYDSANDIYMNADDSDYDDEDYDDEDYDDEDYDDEDYDDEDYIDYDEEDEDDDDEDEEELKPRQDYCGWAMGGKAHYLPVNSLKKYTLRIELKNSKPQVWRELEVPSSISLTSLAQAILLAMGWDEDHLHQFVAKGKDYYSTSSNAPDSPFTPRTKDGSRYGISHLLHKNGDSVIFEYDYGDSWYHAVTLKSKTDYAEDEEKAVRLTNGANACPPDDCGGIYRYNYLVELMHEQPNSPELSDFYEWMGCKWDPTFFPLQEASSAVDGMNDHSSRKKNH